MSLVCCGSTRPLVPDTWGYVCPDCRQLRVPDKSFVPSISPEWAADLLRASQGVYHTPTFAEATGTPDRSEGSGAGVSAARSDWPSGTSQGAAERDRVGRPDSSHGCSRSEGAPDASGMGPEATSQE